jgi:hypothetical protein
MPRVIPLIERLEPRQLLSSSIPFPLQQWFAPAPPYPPVSVVGPTAPPSGKHHHHHHHTAASTPAAAPAPAFAVRGGLLGVWTGQQSPDGDDFDGHLSISVQQSADGGNFAFVKFDRPDGQIILVQSTFTLGSDGQVSFKILTPKIALQFEGTINNHTADDRGYATMDGSVVYWTRAGMFKTNFSIAPVQALLSVG